MQISTHTLTWSVTGEINPQAHWINNFNSHAHVERDAAIRSRFIVHFAISTHTLTWSVTERLDTETGQADNFNSHAHVERDQ